MWDSTPSKAAWCSFTTFLLGHAVLLAKMWTIITKKLTTKSPPSSFHLFLLFPCSNCSLMEKTSDVP